MSGGVVPDGVPRIGVDPGARDTGIIAVDGTRVVMETIHNAGDMLPLDRAYIGRVLDTVAGLLTEFPGAVLLVESVVRPSWHVKSKASHGAATNPEPLLSTAVLLGALLGAFPDAGVVPPGKNGSRPLASYPPALVSDRERSKPGWEMNTKSRGKLRHMRSAWDIANYAGVVDCEPVIESDRPPMSGMPGSAGGGRRQMATVRMQRARAAGETGPKRVDMRRNK